MKETLINITNGLSIVALLAFVVILYLVTREGTDERAKYMGYKLFSFLFTFLLAGLSFIIFVTGLQPIEYEMLRVYITTLMSLTVLIGLIYWLIIKKKI